MNDKEFFCNDCLNFKLTFEDVKRRDGFCEKKKWTIHKTLAICPEFSVRRIEATEITKPEKRIFPRITKEMDIYIRSLPTGENDLPHKARSVSLSEGCMSFIIPETLPLFNGDKISVEFQFDGVLKSVIRVNAKIVHVTEQFLDDGSPFSSAGAAFSDILEYDKLKIKEEVLKYFGEEGE